VCVKTNKNRVDIIYIVRCRFGRFEGERGDRIKYKVCNGRHSGPVRGGLGKGLRAATGSGTGTPWLPSGGFGKMSYSNRRDGEGSCCVRGDSTNAAMGRVWE
jgi:hypothetical protein